MVPPAGLSKRWEDALPKATSEEFTLQVIELNPTISYKVNPILSIGGGIDYGYNLAISLEPIEDIKLAATYRSKINLHLNGTAKLYNSGFKFYDGWASVSTPMPASLDLAVAYKLFQKLTIEAVYEKTYWSTHKQLDFNYAPTQPVFDTPINKNWSDTNTYRLGVTYIANNTLTIMAGYAIDETPIPNNKLGFDLPDSDATIYSVGMNYKLDKSSNIGFGYLYSTKEDRTSSELGGTISDASAHLFSMNYDYSF